MNATALIEQQKYGEAPVDVDYWLGEFDEQRAPQYDDLARFGMNEHEQREFRRVVAEYQEFGPWIG